MITIQKVLNTLKEIKDPMSDQDIISRGFIRNIQIDETIVSFDAYLPPDLHKIVPQIREQIEQMEGVTKTQINLMNASPGQQQSSETPDTLKNVDKIIAVSSCKGGVGKSTIAAHLAFELAQQGKKVGLVDADLHGPSLPTLFHIHNANLSTNPNNTIEPVEKYGIKLMSFGFLLGDAPAVMRGPIVTRYIQQLLMNTNWGELDYLFIDMPPGTSDVHLTITQSIQLTGAVIITTPHTLSMIDVARGILMFEKVSVPIIGVVENMSYFEAPGSDEKQYIFGQSCAGPLEQKFGIQTLAQIPILQSLGQITPEMKSNEAMKEASQAVTRQIEAKLKAKTELPEVSFNEIEITLKWSDGKVWTVNNRELRLNSQDALSVDEMTGEQLIKPEDIRSDIAPKEIAFLGNYAINIAWTDGHSAGIYTYPLIKSLVREESQKS